MLELQPGASLEEVKRAYRDLAFNWHPDRPENTDRQQYVEEHLKKLNMAYDILSHFCPETDFVHLYENACVYKPGPTVSYQEPKLLTRLLQAANTYFWFTVATIFLIWFIIGVTWAVIEDPVPPNGGSWVRGGVKHTDYDSSLIEALLRIN